MPKKRRTRQRKRILKLKRELEKARRKKIQPLKAKKVKKASFSPKAAVRSAGKGETTYQPEYNEGLIKKDLLKTFLLSLLFLALILVFYLKF